MVNNKAIKPQKILVLAAIHHGFRLDKRYVRLKILFGAL